MNNTEFQEIVWRVGRELYRDMPWRESPSPYFVLVSELMLQQTQVARVIPKFQEFIRRFPTLTDLARSSLSDVLVLWSGLGYNRRAKYLWQAAAEVERRFGGKLPTSYGELITLPGIGPNTAGAILNYAHQIPTAFIETNIRSVYFHHFFHDEVMVDDKTLKVLVEATMDREHPREWFWALMDYGTYLKGKGVGAINKSKHYKKQSPLKGSLREMRGAIIRELAVQPRNLAQLKAAVRADERFETALNDLIREGMIENSGNDWRLRAFGG